jgi:hypothetical protein
MGFGRCSPVTYEHVIDNTPELSYPPDCFPMFQQIVLSSNQVVLQLGDAGIWPLNLDFRDAGIRRLGFDGPDANLERKTPIPKEQRAMDSTRASFGTTKRVFALRMSESCRQLRQDQKPHIHGAQQPSPRTKAFGTSEDVLRLNETARKSGDVQSSAPNRAGHAVTGSLRVSGSKSC